MPKNWEDILNDLLSGRITREEAKSFVDAIDNPETKNKIISILEAGFLNDRYEIPANIDREVSIKLKLLSQIAQPVQSIALNKKNPFIKTTRWAAAAVLLFAIAGLAYFFNQKKTNSLDIIAAMHDVAPGRKGALLTLANGSKILLDTVKDGTITMQNGLKVIKQNGEIKYEGTTTEIAYNIASTDRGRQYQIVLADGTTVWLNAESSIRYPLAFNGNERVVDITGEAYFEVAHNASKPFIVKVNGQQIKVLGTHFNVKAYSNEPVVKTTLLEGSVEIKTRTDHAVLEPGQQASTPYSGSGIAVSDADIEEAIAWKNGKFKFQNTELKELMRQLERWYNINVQYEANIGDSHFYGGTQMNNNLSEVLKVLELSGIHFKIEGTTIVVYP